MSFGKFSFYQLVFYIKIFIDISDIFIKLSYEYNLKNLIFSSLHDTQ